MDRLPEDVLAGVLRRLQARDLAACRCVRKEWRGVIDARELLAALLGDLFPSSLRGIFVNYGEYPHSHLLARRTPAGAPQVDGTLDFMPDKRWRTVVDHCNGLLLYEDNNRHYVCNPATRRWGRLPEPRRSRSFACTYLAFDPAVSLHYEVFLLPGVPDQDKIAQVRDLESSIEWPPAQYKMEVFKSRSGRWEKRQFVREGNAVVTLADVASEREQPISGIEGPQQRYAELWKGSLYIHCRGSFLIRLSLSDNKYNNEQVNTPWVLQDYDSYSKGGIIGENYIGMEEDQENSNGSSDGEDEGEKEESEEHSDDTDDGDEDDEEESEEQFEWNNDSDDMEGLENSEYIDDGEGKGNEEVSQDQFEWNLDDDYSLEIEEDNDNWYAERLYFLGFHPYKEVIFLGRNFRAVAYHLGSSKAQYFR
ncbi:hypothetical protein ACP70R_008272 [Stipagrostis hirtigluma subsp. patula]